MKSKLKITACALLVLSLIVLSDFQIFLYPPSYASLRLDYLLSPAVYMAAFVLFRLVIKPRGDKRKVKLNGLVPDKFQGGNHPSRIGGGSGHQISDTNENSWRRGIFQFFRQCFLARFKFKPHFTVPPPSADRNSKLWPFQKRLKNMTNADLRHDLSLWKGEEIHFRRVLKELLSDYAKLFPFWVEAVLFRMRLIPIYAVRILVLRLASLVGIKSPARTND